MQLVKNWQKAYKSLAVLLPTLAVFLLYIIEAAMQTNLIPEHWLPVVIFIAGFIGRVIKQPRIEVR